MGRLRSRAPPILASRHRRANRPIMPTRHPVPADRSPSWRVRLSALAGMLLLAGAAWPDDPEPDAAANPARPRIGLALGGGGARGGAHIGVLKVLDELRIPVDCVAGTSMGALVGATFASGASVWQIEREFLAINWAATLGGEGQRALVPMQRKLSGTTYSNNIQFGVWGGRLHGDDGFLSTQNVEELLRLLVGGARHPESFDDLPIPFRAVATDLAAGEMVVLDRGDLTRAMRASMAVPGVFAPVVLGDQVLADGGLMRNLPVDVVRELCADVVIAVQPESPPPGLVELQSLFVLAGRSIDSMIVANERAQLATLTERDVAILVPVGDIGSGDFARVADAIPLGEGAANAVAAALRRYALPEDEYREWRAQVRQPPSPPVRIDAIRFVPLRHASEEHLATRMRTRPGDHVTLADLERDTGRIFASGDFSRVDYRLLPGAGTGRVLEIHAVEKPGGADFLRFDLGLAGSSGGDVLFAVRADHRREWLNQLGGQWRNSLQLGQLTEIETAIYQPLDVPQRVFAEASLAARRKLEDIFDDGDRIARYDLKEGEARLGLGVNIGNHARVRSGVRWGIHEFDVDIGAAAIVDLDATRDASAVFGAVYDTRDSDALPLHGSYAQLEFARSGAWLGGEQSYGTIEGVAGRVTRWGDNPIMLAAGAGRRVGGELPRYRDFQVGGVRSFPAFSRGELRGEGYWSGSATWMLKLADIQPVLGQVFYSGLGLQAVRVSDRVDGSADETIFGVSFTLGARTPAGPLLLVLGAADNGNVRLHFSLGRPIAEGSLLDRLD
jgi:NTE family protein